MKILKRKILPGILKALESGKSILLLGPRQTGKTTLVEGLPADKIINFTDPRLRLRYEANPGLLIDELSITNSAPFPPLIVIDEVQKVPEIMDSVQYLIDKKQARFVLTGSSARKLKRNKDINLLPGRVIAFHLDPLMTVEIPKSKWDIKTLMMYGSLPEIISYNEDQQKNQLLESYVITYLEEEVRAEAMVRHLGSFSRFLELAAAESGYAINLSKMSQRIGVSSSTIESYYQILEDCLVAERVEALSQSKTRHRLSKSHKYLFFDLGVRRLAALEGPSPPLKYLGHLFEQFIGLELIRLARLQDNRVKIRYWRDQNGPEIDWIVDFHDRFIPIEVKWSDKPTLQESKHLKLFIDEYPEAQQGFIVCNTPAPFKISEQVTAIPWQELAQWVFSSY